MKILFWLFVVIGMAILLPLAAKYNDGYVLVMATPYRIELSLNLFLALLVALFFLFYVLLRVSTHTLRLPVYVRRFRADRQRDKSHNALLQGLLAFTEGRYAKAEKWAVSALDLQQAPEVTSVLAARSAHELKAYERRDHHLAQGQRLAPDYPVARLMAQAKFLIDERHYSEALMVLKSLHEIAPKHLAALKLELKAQQQVQNWDQVLSLVTTLEKRNAIEPWHAEQLKINVHVENLRRRLDDKDELSIYWQKIPAAERLQHRIAATAARYFNALGDGETAQKILEQALEARWDNELVLLYGDCIGHDLTAQIERAERWLTRHPRDARLLLTLGKFCTAQSLWGKAQSYLEASLGVGPSKEAHIALAQLFEKLGRESEACREYRASVAEQPRS